MNKGVKEYWLIDSARKVAEVYALGRDGKYVLVKIADGVFRSSVVKGFWIEVDWLWQRPLPSILHVLKQSKVV